MLKKIAGVVLVAVVAFGILVATGGQDTPEEAAAKALKKAAAPANDTLTLAYINHVKGPKASFVRCDDTMYQGRYFVLCGVSYGGVGLAQRGLWEAAEDDGKLVLYPMNGPASAALGKIGESQKFRAGYGRRADVSAILAKFGE